MNKKMTLIFVLSLFSLNLHAVSQETLDKCKQKLSNLNTSCEVPAILYNAEKADCIDLKDNNDFLIGIAFFSVKEDLISITRKDCSTKSLGLLSDLQEVNAVQYLIQLTTNKEKLFIDANLNVYKKTSTEKQYQNPHNTNENIPYY